MRAGKGLDLFLSLRFDSNLAIARVFPARCAAGFSRESDRKEGFASLSSRKRVGREVVWAQSILYFCVCKSAALGDSISRR